ncbi:MAG: hypothetical protein GC168_04405 [Candidatus Hydrogenedens sp.]|nr:hypothetical protein [Candidatus Hydrogenedens sp.]
MSEIRIKAPERLHQAEGLALLRDAAGRKLKADDQIVIDFKDTVAIDSTGGASLVRLSEWARSKGARLQLDGAGGQAAEFIDIIRPTLETERPSLPRTEGAVEKLGGSGIAAFGEIGEFFSLVNDSVYWTLIAPLTGRGIRWNNFLDELYEMGYRAVGIVCLMNFLLGLIIAMLLAKQAEAYGIQLFVADIMMIGFARELAAIMTAIVVSARTGAAIAAEISTMKVQEEVDALRGMGLNVVEFLVAPKLLAMLIVLPCLVMLGMYAGIGGGAIWGVYVLGFQYDIWLNQTLKAAYFSDLLQGISKTFVFAVFIVLIGCHNGFRVKGGSRGVGLMTTRSVVMDIFMLITVDILFAVLFYYVFE